MEDFPSYHPRSSLTLCLVPYFDFSPVTQSPLRRKKAIDKRRRRTVDNILQGANIESRKRVTKRVTVLLDTNEFVFCLMSDPCVRLTPLSVNKKLFLFQNDSVPFTLLFPFSVTTAPSFFLIARNVLRTAPRKTTTTTGTANRPDTERVVLMRRGKGGCAPHSLRSSVVAEDFSVPFPSLCVFVEPVQESVLHSFHFNFPRLLYDHLMIVLPFSSTSMTHFKFCSVRTTNKNYKRKIFRQGDLKDLERMCV